MKKAVFVLLGAAIAFGLTPNSAKAIKPFYDEFKVKYVKADGSAEEKAYAEKVEKVKCDLCHKGKDKKVKNAYGEALDKLLDKKTDAKDKAKIATAFDTVADQKSPAGPTFGELIKEGKLPVGE